MDVSDRDYVHNQVSEECQLIAVVNAAIHYGIISSYDIRSEKHQEYVSQTGIDVLNLGGTTIPDDFGVQLRPLRVDKNRILRLLKRGICIMAILHDKIIGWHAFLIESVDENGYIHILNPQRLFRQSWITLDEILAKLTRLPPNLSWCTITPKSKETKRTSGRRSPSSPSSPYP